MEKNYKLKVKLVGGQPPNQSHPGQDAGYDVFAMSEPRIVGYSSNGESYDFVDFIEYDTGIQIEPIGTLIEEEVVGSGNVIDVKYDVPIHTLLFPRSSISKTNLMLKNSVGLADQNYRGNLLLRFHYCYTPSDLIFEQIDGKMYASIKVDKEKIYKKGDKIAQLVFSETVHPEIQIVEELTDTSRAGGGFGSTGK